MIVSSYLVKWAHYIYAIHQASESWIPRTPITWFMSPKCVISDITTVIVNKSKPEQKGKHFADGIFKCIFVKQNVLYWLEFHRNSSLVVQSTITLDSVNGLVWKAPSHYLHQCSTRYTKQHGLTRPQWAKQVFGIEITDSKREVHQTFWLLNQCLWNKTLCNIFILLQCFLMKKRG